MRRLPPLKLSLPLIALLLALLLCAAPASADPQQERRVALVIGNGAYPTAPLKNPVNDASDMAAALKRLGFEVTLLRDATMQQMEGAVREFGLALRRGGLGLFYFAGHGVQVAGENYLVPVNAVIQSEGDVKYGCLNAGLVLAKMEDAGNGPNVVILDACRNNPFARSFRSAEAGLARMDAPTGSLIAYATAPGKVASDGDGRNGLYTQHLLRNIGTPGLSISDLFMNVREAVVRDSAKKQVPWENTSLIGRFSLAGQPALSVPAPAPTAQQAAAPAPQQTAAAKPVPTGQPAQPAPTKKAGMVLQSPAEEELLRVLEQSEDNPARVRVLAEPLAAKGSAFGQMVLGMASKDPAEKLRLITLSANQGFPRAMTLLGMFNLYGENGKSNPKAAREWLRKGAEGGDAGAKTQLGEMLFEGKGGPKDPKAGERLLLDAAQEDPAHYRTLVNYYWNGVFVPKDEAKGFGLYAKAAEAGLADAVSNMGGFYERGDHVAPNNAEAVKWYRRAAEQGDSNAAFRLGLMYEKGRGVGQNDSEAAKMFRQAEDSNSEAALWLGILYENGRGVAQDYAAAAARYRKSVELQDASDGKHNLARLYELGLGVEKNYAEAFRLYKAAADQGLVSSMQAVGGFYYDGKGVPQNYDEALKWYRKAAERGFAQSQYNLGVMYYTGTALTQSNAQAYLWFALAAAAGDALAPAARDEVAKKLSAAELSKMQAQAIRWKTITP